MKALEELRIFSNMNLGKNPILQVFLSGQPELQTNLSRPRLKQIVQRVSVSYQLSSFNLVVSNEYIWYRRTRASGNANLFDSEACAAAYLFSRGVPRIVNLICDTALVLGPREGTPRVGVQIMLYALDTMQAGGLSNHLGVSEVFDKDKLIAEIYEITSQIWAISAQ